VEGDDKRGMEDTTMQEEVGTPVSGPVVIGPGERTLSMAGVNLSLPATRADVGAAFGMLDYTALTMRRRPSFAGRRRTGMPHWHAVTTEGFYVLEGVLSLRLGEGDIQQTVEAPAGTSVLVPPRTVHAFSNPGTVPARFIVVLSPAGMEGYFNELAELMRSEPSWPPADMSRVLALAERFDTFAPPVVRPPF
jgi:mannose-6-phosphate isomerase-like protein (cupin superfamily)